MNILPDEYQPVPGSDYSRFARSLRIYRRPGAVMPSKVWAIQYRPAALQRALTQISLFKNIWRMELVKAAQPPEFDRIHKEIGALNAKGTLRSERGGLTHFAVQDVPRKPRVAILPEDLPCPVNLLPPG